MATEERLPPSNRAAEQCVLGSIMRENSVMTATADILTPDSFYLDAHQKIFALMVELHNASKPIDMVVLADLLKSRSQIDDVGGYAYLAVLWEAAPTAANCQYYANIVREKSDARRLIRVCTDALRDAYDDAPVDDLVAQTQRDIMAIGSDARTSINHDIVTVLHEVQAQIDARSKLRGPTGVPSGLIDLDTITAGFQPGELCILAARPSVGKTAFAINILRNAAKAGSAGLIFSIEQERHELVSRMLAGEAEIDSYSLRSGRLTSDEVARIVLASGSIAPMPIWINDTPGQRVRNIVAAARRLQTKTDLKLVVIDYLQLLNTDDRRLPRHEQVAQMSRELKLAARELGLPIICLAQLNRQAEATNERPKLSHLRESGAIEQDADTVIFLHRVGERDNKTPTEIIEAIVAKQRNGPTGVVTLVYRKAQLKFENSAPTP